MHTVDVVAVVAFVIVLALLAAVLARQRYMLGVAGGLPVAIRVRNSRWIYGIARYVGGELRWYRAIGIGTRPSRVMRRSALRIVARRQPSAAELSSLPAGAVVVDCREGDLTTTLAFSDSAYTGFASWLESSAPRGSGAA